MTKLLGSKISGFVSLKVNVSNIFKAIIVSLFFIIILFSIFSFLIFIVFPDKIMDGAPPDYSKNGEVLKIAADRIEIVADDQEYTFTLNPAGNTVQIISGEKTESASVSNIKRGDKVRIEGWSNKNKVEVGTIYLYK